LLRGPDLWLPRSPHPHRLRRRFPRPRSASRCAAAGGSRPWWWRAAVSWRCCCWWPRPRRCLPPKIPSARACGGGRGHPPGDGPAPLLAPQDPVRQSLRGRLAPPTWNGADGRAHLLGTDHLGRDVLSRVIYGSRVSLVVGFAAVIIGGVLGSAAGLVAGFSRGRLDAIIMTVADAQLAF